MTECSICRSTIVPERHPLTQKIIWEGGHNAWPLTEDRSCNDCHGFVLSARIKHMQLKDQENKNEVAR